MDPVRPAACDDDRRVEVESVLKDISGAQEEEARGFRPDVSELVGEPRSAFPLLTPEKVRIDWDRFERLLARILDILKKWAGDAAHDEGIAGLPLSEGYRTFLLAEAIRGEGALRERGEEHDVDGDVFAPAVRYAFAPFLKAYAKELDRSFDEEPDLRGRCPVCGAEPFMAEFDSEDGRRLLACGLCGTEWRFARMKCPFCGNEDQRKLGYLEIEDLEGYRAYVCESCKRYVKTVDRRKVIGEIDLETADALTPELDEAATSGGVR